MIRDPLRRALFLRHLSAWLVSDPYRNLLSAAGLILGVAGVIVTLSLVVGESRRFLDRLRLVGTRSLYVTPREGALPEIGAEGLRRSFAEVQRATRIRAMHRNVQGTGADSAWVPVLGVEPEYFEILQEVPLRGRSLSPVDLRLGSAVCVIGEGLHRRLGRPDVVRLGVATLRVVGVLEAPMGEGGDTGLICADPGGSLLVPASLALAPDRKDRPQEHLLIQVRHEREIESLRERLQELLDRRSTTGVRVETSQEILRRYRSTRGHLTTVLTSMSALALLLGGLGILNNMLAVVLERLPEIGVRISMGATRRDILIQFLAETLLVAAMGSLTGVLLGVPAVGLLALLEVAPVALTGWSVALPPLLGLLIGGACGALPAARAARLRPIETLTLR